MDPIVPGSNEPRSPDPARPFAPARAGASRGCGRPVWFGCGAVLVLLGIAAIVFVVKAKDLLAWGMERIEAEVMATLPDDLTPEERARLERGFDAALEKISLGEVEPPALNALQKQLVQAAEKANERTLTRDDALDLLSALERVGGLLEAEAEPGPSAGGEPGEALSPRTPGQEPPPVD
ncbi:MAG TPA: hypothetical protein VLA66_08330 [Thermoanaerobaculia bacterium]|nr:hypothetical protein [Thermoanaerobaculia bacterium]